MYFLTYIFSPLLSKIAFCTGTVGQKKVSRGRVARKQNILHLIFITLFIQYSWQIQVNNVTSAVVQMDVQGRQERTKPCCCPRVSQSCTASLPAEVEGTN